MCFSSRWGQLTTSSLVTNSVQCPISLQRVPDDTDTSTEYERSISRRSRRGGSQSFAIRSQANYGAAMSFQLEPVVRPILQFALLGYRHDISSRCLLLRSKGWCGACYRCGRSSFALRQSGEARDGLVQFWPVTRTSDCVAGSGCCGLRYSSALFPPRLHLFAFALQPFSFDKQ